MKEKRKAGGLNRRDLWVIDGFKNGGVSVLLLLLMVLLKSVLLGIKTRKKPTLCFFFDVCGIVGSIQSQRKRLLNFDLLNLTFLGVISKNVNFVS